MKKIALFFLVSLLSIASLASATVRYSTTNNSTTTPGGLRFTAEIGLKFSSKVLAFASSFIWSLFGQCKPQDRKNVTSISLTIESMPGIAYTMDNEIHMSAEYIGNYSGDLKFEFLGIMYHEVTHVWQWSGGSDEEAPSGVIEGVADYVRLKAGYVPGHWVKPGGGSRWDQGYDVTARFLDYCGGRKAGFVEELNAKMKDGYSDGFFEELLGESVDALWKEYKAKYAG